MRDFVYLRESEFDDDAAAATSHRVVFLPPEMGKQSIWRTTVFDCRTMSERSLDNHGWQIERSNI